MPDASTPLGPPSWRRELRTIIVLSSPLAAAQLAQMGMATTDTIMMGRIDSTALAAGGLGTTVAMLMILIAQGLLQSIQPIVAQARGAGDHRSWSRMIAGGLLGGTILALPIILVLTRIDHVLIAIGEPPEIAQRALIYELAFAWGIPASLWQSVVRNYLAALEHTRIIMLVSGCACAINVLLNWLLIFGHWGFPAMGLAGSGYATATVWWGMALALGGFAWGNGLLPHDLWRVRWREAWRGLSQICRLGWPIAGAFAVEIGLFSGSALLMGRFGAVALATHQICLNLTALTFMVPAAIGNAAAVRVGFHIGSGALGQARMAGLLAMGLGIGFMSIAALTIRLLSRPILLLYLDPADPNLPLVLALGGSLITLAALFQVFDGAQVVAAGALRGLRDTKAAFAAATIGYWGLGMPIGAYLAFRAGFGPVGLWWGILAGLSVVSTLLCLRFHLRTNHMIALARR